MRLARPITLGAAALIASAAAAPALAAASPRPTSLTLRTAHSTVTAKHHDTFTATLKAGKTPLDGATVKLYEKKPGAKTWTPLGTKTTNAKGQATYTVTPAGRKGQKDEFEVKFGGGKIGTGTTTYGASHSKIVTVTIS
jgi:hypothetical protein